MRYLLLLLLTSCAASTTGDTLGEPYECSSSVATVEAEDGYPLVAVCSPDQCRSAEWILTDTTLTIPCPSPFDRALVRWME